MNKASAFTYDAILLGAGGAGLLLLQELLDRGWLQDRKVLVVEPEVKDGHDRTWCFWGDGDDALSRKYSDIISHRWTQVNNGMGRTEQLLPFTYCQIRSGDFYHRVKTQILPYVNWISSRARAVTVSAHSTSVEIDGHVYSSAYVFDSRPPTPESLHDSIYKTDSLWQSFFGFRISTEKTLDENICTLMNFNVPQDGASQFVYVLPTSHHEALVELTRFGQDCLNSEGASQILEEFVHLHFGKVEILETETGRIPMTLALNPKRRYHPLAASYIPLGTRAGAVKSTTGYAFMNMAHHAERVVAAMMQEKRLPTAYHAERHAFYDRLLLRVLIDSPEKGKEIFQQLFRKCSTSKVLRFLDERTHLGQELRILSALPYPPFLKALFSVTRDQMKRSIFPSAKNSSPEGTGYSGIPIMLATIILVIWNLLWPAQLASTSPYILLAGLIFPGIPHGAIDHWIAFDSVDHRSKMGLFVMRYVSVMVVIALLWLMSPLVGFLLFLTYSAWHFGETDSRDWRSYKPTLAFMWGVSVLGVLLFGHFSSLEPYMEAYAIAPFYNDLLPYSFILFIGSLGLMGAIGLSLPGRAKRPWIVTSLILIAGTFLPLLLAFALYFIGCHSFRGWNHLRSTFRDSTKTLLIKAMPFSAGAWVLGGLSLAAISQFGFEPDALWPFVFAFIAALSAPHVIMMHLMYRKAAD